MIVPASLVVKLQEGVWLVVVPIDEALRREVRQAGRPMLADDIWRQTLNMVPLSKTMAEQVNVIRDWAFNRAVPASSKRYFKRSG